MQVSVTPPTPGTAPVIQIGAGPGNQAQTIAIPQTVEDIAGLRARRSELVDQLDRAMNRRGNITEDMAQASGAERAGLEQRMGVLDQRIAQIEADIAATERALTAAPAALLATARQSDRAAELAERSGFDSEPFIAIPAVFTLFVLFPIALAYARRIWKRSPAVRALPENTERLERIEQAIEAIAVEVERVSEGQRFVTKLMSEGKAVPLRDQTRLMPESKAVDS